MGALEDREGQPVGLQDGVQDQDVDGLPRILVGEPDEAEVLGVDALHAPRHVAPEGLEGRGAVDAVVGRGEGEPGGVRGLDPRRGPLAQGGKEGQGGHQDPEAHTPVWTGP